MKLMGLVSLQRRGEGKRKVSDGLNVSIRARQKGGWIVLKGLFVFF